MEVDIMTKTKQLGFEKLSNEELNDIIGGGQIWDAIFSPFQSTPSWVQGRKHETTATLDIFQAVVLGSEDLDFEVTKGGRFNILT